MELANFIAAKNMSKAKTFHKAPDGKEFENKADFRDYMMEKFLSFKGLKNISNVLIKKSGDVAGQCFEIADCENCQLVVMDHCGQTQIDDLTDCRVFIGACSDSIFVRNCTNCLFYLSCRQLRLRDCKSSKFYTLSPSEIHIELSSSVQFAPMNAGYPEHLTHLQMAGLDPSTNRWYDIYDHNDPEKTCQNWDIVPEDEYGQPWFPSGECEIVGDFSKPIKIITAPPSSGQVGESFSIHQMMEDSRKIGVDVSVSEKKREVVTVPQSAGKKPEQIAAHIGLEVALLVESAISKEIDVSVWFLENADDGNMSIIEFTRQLVSLANMVGLNEDASTKKELDEATSPPSINNILQVCGSGNDELGTPQINVSMFISLCRQKVQECLAEEDDGAYGADDNEYYPSSELNIDMDNNQHFWDTENSRSRRKQRPQSAPPRSRQIMQGTNSPTGSPAKEAVFLFIN